MGFKPDIVNLMKELLHQHISNHVTIPEKERDRFCNLFKHQLVKKKRFLLQQGETCKFEGFVIKGLFRVYHVDQNGFENILYFAIENWWITDIDSFTNNTPSQLYIEALEDSEVLLISKKDKEFAYINLPQIEKLFRIMTQKTHVALQRRMIDNLSKTADQRYLDFIKKYPQLLQRLTNLQIAAYLGISHEFLSKIRKKIVTGS
jgi:CRP-like cAMP-binding protein